jgi:hypothetical protein
VERGVEVILQDLRDHLVVERDHLGLRYPELASFDQDVGNIMLAAIWVGGEIGW